MDRIVYIVINGFFTLLSVLPLRLLRWLGVLIGELLWLSHSDTRKVTEENLQICFPELPPPERLRLARESLHQLGMLVSELGMVWKADSDQVIKRITRFSGVEHLDAALAAGKGAIVLAPHIGNWEVVGLYLAKHYIPTFMYQPPDNPALDRLIYQARQRNGASLAPTNTSGVKTLLRALKRGEVVGVLPDQVPPAAAGGKFAPFFGIPALTATLSHSLLQRTGARAVFGYAKRLPSSGEFELVFLPVDEALYSEDELTSLTALNHGVEATVNDVPEQYQWEYKRFRKQPDGKRKYYLKHKG